MSNTMTWVVANHEQKLQILEKDAVIAAQDYRITELETEVAKLRTILESMKQYKRTTVREEVAYL